MNPPLRQAIRFATALILLGSPGWAQTDAELGGTVTDSTAAVIPDVAITVTHLETGVERTTTSNEQGYFVVPLLQPGDYRINLAKDGFRPITQTGITLYAGLPARINFTMDIGAVTEEVTVTAAAPLLETATPAQGQVIDNQKIVDLPLNGRDYIQLALLSAGAGAVPFGRFNTFSASGMRANQNNFMLDGVDNNSMQRAGQARRAEVIKPSIDAIQEFKLSTNAYSAEFGRGGGAIVNVSLKSGTNRLHGSIFEFLRNEKLDAKNFFDPPDRPRPPFKRNQYGFAIGGPIVKDKTFFFGDYEGTRIRESRTVNNTIPTPMQLQGDFSELLPGTRVYDPSTYDATTNLRQPFPDNRIPATNFDPIGAMVLNLYPTPNKPGLTRNFLFNPPQPEDLDRWDAKIDHNLSASDRFFVRYSLSSNHVGSTPNLPEPAWGGGQRATPFDHDGQNLVVNYNRVFSPSFIMEMKGAWNRLFTLRSSPIDVNFNEQLGLTGVELADPGMAQFTVQGLQIIGLGSWIPNKSGSQNRQWITNFTWIRGDHTLKFGINFSWLQHFLNNSQNAHGVFTFDGGYTRNSDTLKEGSSAADLLLGTTTRAQVSTWVWENMRRPYYDAYFQDEWRVSPRLTLNLGLRYELHPPWVDRMNNGANLDFSDRSNPRIVPMRDGTRFSRALVSTDGNNFAPRLGIVYRLKEKTVVRTGYGIFYGNTNWKNVLATFPPFFYRATVQTDRVQNTLQLSKGLASDLISPQNARNIGFGPIDMDLPMAYTQQWNFAIQHELPSQTLFEVGYVGSVSNRLSRAYDINVPLPGPGAVNGRRPIRSLVVPPDDITIGPIAGLNYFERTANANYHAVQTRLEKRLTHGLSMLSSYTWSKNISDGRGAGGVGGTSSLTAQNPHLLSAERALSDEHFAHRFVASPIYQLPIGRGKRFLTDSPSAVNALLGGWTLASIVTLSSGGRANLSVRGNPANTGTANRPNWLSEWRLGSGTRSLDRWFDTEAFERNAPYTYGNAARNLIEAPGLVNLDLAIYKAFSIQEGLTVQFRAEAFNVSNTPAFARPNTQVGNRNFGQIAGAGRPRNLQFGLKIIF